MEVPHGELFGVRMTFDRRSCVIQPPPVELNGGKECLTGAMSVVTAQSCPKVARLIRCDGFKVAQATGRCPRSEGRQGAQHRFSQIVEKADDLEQFTAPSFVAP